MDAYEIVPLVVLGWIGLSVAVVVLLAYARGRRRGRPGEPGVVATREGPTNTTH